MMWAPNIEALSRDRTVVTWDLPGHGASDAPEEDALERHDECVIVYSHDACLIAMGELLDQVDAPSAVLGGMSLGGYLSLAFHQRFPQRVAGLVLVDTGPGFRDPAARERWNAWARELADDLDSRGLAALPPGREQAPGQHLSGAPGLARAARGILTQQDATVLESLGSIAVPTLIVVGSQDTRFLPAADVMEQRIPGARKVVLEGAGHAANLDAPDRFNAEVGRFLEEL